MVNVFREGWLTFKSIFTGMSVTFRHLFGSSVTLQYPDEKMELPEGARSRLYVNIDDCIGCNLCVRACPVNCIDLEKVKATSDADLGKTSTGNPKRFWITKLDIDMAKCMFCDLCVQPCPTECIYMVPEYEYSEYDRDNLIYHFSELSPGMVAEVIEKAAKEAEEKKKKAAKKKKKASSKKKRTTENGKEDQYSDKDKE